MSSYDNLLVSKSTSVIGYLPLKIQSWAISMRFHTAQ